MTTKGVERLTQSMENNVAVVTGATSGIGRASVVDFAKRWVNALLTGGSMDLSVELRAETRRPTRSVPTKTEPRIEMSGSDLDCWQELSRTEMIVVGAMGTWVIVSVVASVIW